ncbi:MAG TPA: hypothetical protein VFA08_12605 [Actinomycetota bacterium]|jgi:hypothetical protein|nr:hypothetical protein [Actinomycetota bacterium]
MARRASGFATVLAVVGAALLVLGALGLWIDAVIGDADAFTAQADDLIERPEIRAALADAAIDPLFEGAPAALSLQRELAVGLIAGVLADDRFVVAFEQILRLAHTRLIESERGPVRIGLEGVVDVARDDLSQISPLLAARIDVIETPEIVVVARPEAQALRVLLDLARAYSVPFLIAGAVMVLIGVLRNGGRGLVAAGVAATVTSAVLFVALLATREGVVGGVQAGRAREAVGAGWDVVVSGLLGTLTIAAGAGVVATVLGLLFSGARRGRRATA